MANSLKRGVGMVLAGLAAGVSPVIAADTFVYFGTYTGGTSRGIYVSRLQTETGVLTAPELAAETRNPSFLALAPNGTHLYAVGELDQVEGRPGGAVSAFAIDRATGRLKFLNQQSSRGAGPCHLVVDGSGRWVLVANYSGGSVASLPIRPEGSLGEAVSVIQHQGSSVNPQRQKQPHAHSINLDRANRFAVAADLGTDRLMVYRWDPVTGILAPNDPPFTAVTPGSGPRHFAFHPGGRAAFAIHELASTVTTYRYRPRRGVLEETATLSTLPPGYAEPTTTAEIQVHPGGEFVYGSNRGHDSIAVFRYDREARRLTLVEHEPTQGRTPRNFGIDPTGRWLLAANQASDSVVVFRIDPATGALTPAGQTVTVGTPVCVKFLAVP